MQRGVRDVYRMNNGPLSISRYKSVQWDMALDTMMQVRITDMPSPELDQDSRLTAQDLLAVEKAMEPGKEWRVWDILTEDELAPPFSSQWGHVWMDECLQGDALASGRKPPVAFCIYTSLQQVEDKNAKRIWIPRILTYHSEQSRRFSIRLNAGLDTSY